MAELNKVFLNGRDCYPNSIGLHHSEFEEYHWGMRVVLIFIAAGLLLVEWGGFGKPAGTTSMAFSAAVATTSSEKHPVDFDTQVKPIFKSKCMPCHFSGGQMYDRLPFDKPETIRTLGTRLFTRIKEENDRRLIEEFLTQRP